MCNMANFGLDAKPVSELISPSVYGEFLSKAVQLQLSLRRTEHDGGGASAGRTQQSPAGVSTNVAMNVAATA